jgi:hypothetical protein
MAAAVRAVRTGYTTGMSTAFLPARPRRALVLGSLTVLLHWAVLDWINSQVGRSPIDYTPHTVTTFAELVRATPVALTVPQPQPFPVHPLPLPPLPPTPVPPVPETAMPADGPGEGGDVQTASAGPADAPPVAAGQASAAPAPADVQSGAQPAPAAPAPAPPAAPTYRVDLPPAAEMTMDVDRVDADGTHWTGEAALGWRYAAGLYNMKVEVGIRLLFTRVNLLVLTSEGAAGDDGFAPTLMTEKRRGRALTATHFNRADGTMTFSASQNSYPLVPGAQDKASVPLQLTAIARADPAQLSGNVDLLVGEDRDASVYHFVLLGQEDIDTKVGRLHVWHLSRPPKPGSYSSRLDVWLAPERGWYPVRIRNTEASGALTTQTVSNIQITGTGS